MTSYCFEQTQVKVEASGVKQLLEDGVDEGEEVNLLHSGHPPIMIRGEDGVLYQVRLMVYYIALLFYM